MQNKKYLDYVLDHNDVIFVDTCTLMHSDSARYFLESAEEALLSKDKKIILTQWVLKELNKHIESDDPNTIVKAKEALRIIDDFKTLFVIEEEHNTESLATFADSDFLSKLTLNKSRASQLLITPDKDLALDAFNLNGQESNKGYRIMVCHINRAGHIKKCSCINKTEYEPEKNTNEPEIVLKEKVVYKDRPVETLENKKDYKVIAGGIAGGFLGGILFNRYAMPMIKKAFIAV